MSFVNESGMDRIIRVVVGIVLLALYLSSTVTGTLGVVSLILGIVALVTGAIGYCPLYALLKIRTNRS